MAPLRAALQWWLGTFEGLTCPFVYSGEFMEHGVQEDDTFSCGIVTYNTIAHDIFGDELWTIKTRKRIRIDCFNAIVMMNNQLVSTYRTFLRNRRYSLGVSQRSPRPSQSKTSRALPADIKATPQECQKAASPVSHLQAPRDLGTARPVCPPQAPRDLEQEVLSPDCHLQAPRGFGLKASSPVTRTQAPRDLEQIASYPFARSQAPRDLEPRIASSIACLQAPRDLKQELIDVPLRLEAADLGGRGSGSCSTPSEANHQDDNLDNSLPKNTGQPANAPTVSGKQKREDDLDGSDRALNTMKQKIRKTGRLDAFFQSAGRHSPERGIESESEESSGESFKMDIDHEMKREGFFVGQSRSARNSKKLREVRLNGTQALNPTRSANFQARIRRIDPNAQFNPAEWAVQHSVCRHWIRMKSPFSPIYFVNHAHRCKTGPTLEAFSFSHHAEPSPKLEPKSSSSPPSPRYEERPCSGLRESDDPRIGTYLLRLTALGGGGKSKSFIADECYGMAYSELTEHQRGEVDRLNESQWLWIVRHEHQAVFSTSCTKTVQVLVSGEKKDETVHACPQCRSVIFNKRFRTAISLPEPSRANVKFTNKKYHQSELAIKFARCKGAEELINPKVSL